MNPRVSLRIAGREVRALFNTPGGYLIIGIFWFVAGLFLYMLLLRYREAGLQLARSGKLPAGPEGLHVNDYVIRPFLYTLGMIVLFFVPLLTMKSFAEERRTGSLELLLSQPLRGGDVLLGKFFGACGALLVCLSILILDGIALAAVSRPDWGATLAGLCGLILLGFFFISVGVLVSVLSRSQVESGVLSLGALLAVWFGPDAVSPSNPGLASVFSFFSTAGRFEDFTRGVLDLGHVCFLFGATLLLLVLALKALDLVRWQG